jgi:hypothetical protein
MHMIEICCFSMIKVGQTLQKESEVELRADTETMKEAKEVKQFLILFLIFRAFF